MAAGSWCSLPRWRMLCSYLFVCLITGLPPAAAAQQLKLTMNEKAAEQKVAAKLLQEIYRKAGLSALIQPVPGERANAMTRSGEMDGETARIRAYSERNPGLVRIEPAYYHLTPAVFAKRGRKIAIAARGDLAPYRVGVVRGITHAENAAIATERVETVDDYEQMFRMLAAGRIDLAIDTDINGRAMIAQLGLADIEQVGTLDRLELFHLLHARNTALAPRLSATIRALKTSGELEKMTKRYEQELLGNGGPN